MALKHRDEGGDGNPASKALAIWADAWSGVSQGDETSLERARSALDGVLNSGSGDGLGVSRVHARGTLALVLLGLGGSGEGTRRLAEALGEARRALDEAGPSRATRATMTALAGRIALALGRALGDETLLLDARSLLAKAQLLARSGFLPGACGLDGLTRELLDAERALSRSGGVSRRPARERSLVRSGPS